VATRKNGKAVPLSAFSFNDPFEIWAAFHPENHRWLKKEENLSKNVTFGVGTYKLFEKKIRI
jgi:hypothetical protein